MRRTSPFWGLFLSVLVIGGMACTTERDESDPGPATDEPELAQYMRTLQHWSHKTALALEARNAELANFYLHEMEETLETLQTEAPTYEGHPVGDLTKKMLVPSVEALDGALDDRAWPTVDERVQELAQSCNQCHAATGYDFIRVELQDVPNPYAQEFDTSASR